MHILELTIDYIPDTLYGMGIHVAHLAFSLANHGHRVTVVTRNNSGCPTESFDGPLLRVLRCDPDWDRTHLQNRAVPREIGPIQGQIGFCEEMHRILGEKGIRCDVIHNHNYATVPLACELCEYWGVPLISTVHAFDGAFERARVFRPRLLGRQVIRALEAEGFKRSSAIIVPSTTAARWLVDEHPFCASRVRVIPHPRSKTTPVKRSYAAHVPFRVLFVGRLMDYKGITYLFEALFQLPQGDVECWVVGDGRLRPTLEQQAREKGLPVRWLGHLPYEAVLELYGEVDVLVVPSLVETYGLVLQEGLQVGLPVVASALDVFAERITDGVNGLLVPIRFGPNGAYVDVPTLAEAITRLIRDDELRQRLGENATKMPQQNPGSAEYAQEFLKIASV